MTRRIRREACLHCHIVPTARQNRRRMGFPDPNVMSVEMKATLARWRKSAQTPRGLDLACRDAEGRMWAHREDDERALQSQGREGRKLGRGDYQAVARFLRSRCED